MSNQFSPLNWYRIQFVDTVTNQTVYPVTMQFPSLAAAEDYASMVAAAAVGPQQQPYSFRIVELM